MSKRQLPVVGEPASSLHKDGSRNYVHPADVKGRFTRARHITFAVLIFIYLLLPILKVGGQPAMFLDIAHRRFHLFGASFNAQDFWLVLFLLTGIALVLFVVTTLYGRVWCGYACPQTVFLEGLYRPIERLIEGPRNERIRRNNQPMSFDKLWRKTLKHTLYVLLSLFISHFILGYFVSLPALGDMMTKSPAEHPEAFAWMAAMSAIFYFNFAWFREQLCLIICPYGRLQSTLTDQSTMIIGYDEVRGEPRGKKSDPNAGDCIDCKRCVVVCPTGIDIRNGLQMECIGCAACVDACDEMMIKVGRDPGLIRYDSTYGLEHRERGSDGESVAIGEGEGKKKSWRPRLLLYGIVASIWLAVTVAAFSSRSTFEANLLRPPVGRPYIVEDDEVRNGLRIHVVNKTGETQHYTVEGLPGDSGIDINVRRGEFDLEAGEDLYVPVVATGTRTQSGQVRLRVSSGEESKVVEAAFLGPGG